MKKFILLSGFAFLVVIGHPQNIQLHYDLGKARNGIDRERGFFTSTIEMFRPDPFGSTFFFTDMDYNGYRGVSRAYMEIARNISIGNFLLQPRIEYNGGLVLLDTLKGNSITNAWLFGLNCPLRIGKGNFGTYLVYKYIPGNTYGPDFQWTLNWNYPLWNGKASLNGFFDIWSTDKTVKGKKVILLTEPQLWIKTWKQIYLGSEVEISNAFYPTMQGFRAFPTLAAKVIFLK